MACQSCQKARQAASLSFKALVLGDVKTAAGEASKAISAVAEKAESMRVRAITGRR